MLLAIIMILAFTPTMHRYANEYRNQFGIEKGIGSEYIVWLYPLIYLPIYLERRGKKNVNKETI